MIIAFTRCKSLRIANHQPRVLAYSFALIHILSVLNHFALLGMLPRCLNLAEQKSCKRRLDKCRVHRLIRLAYAPPSLLVTYDEEPIYFSSLLLCWCSVSAQCVSKQRAAESKYTRYSQFFHTRQALVFPTYALLLQDLWCMPRRGGYDSSSSMDEDSL